MDQQDEAPGGALAALDRLVRACETALDRIEDADDLQGTFEAAGRMIRRIEELRDAAIQFRDQTITAIWQVEELSLAKLAKRTGISKARADQITRDQTGRPGYRRNQPPKETPDE